MNRLFKHNRLFFAKDLKVVDAIPKYPQECNEEEKFIVESTARMSINVSIQQRTEP